MQHKKTRLRMRGQAALMFGLFLVPTLGMAGLALDVGRMYSARRQAQAAADIAASAGAHEMIRRTSEQASFEAVALNYAARNGFSTDKGDSIILNNPPTDGPHAGEADAYEVIVRRQVPTTLLRVVGKDAGTVEGRAVALAKKTGIGILVLDESKCKAFEMKKSSRLTLRRDSILHVNSDCSNEAMFVEKSEIYSDQPPTVVGGVNLKSGAKVEPSDPVEGADVMDDPLASLPPPPNTLPVRHGTGLEDKCGSGDPLRITTDQTLCPGIYYCGIIIDSGAQVTLDACGMPPTDTIYEFAGGRFEIKKQGVSLAGTGVIYSTLHPKDSKKKCPKVSWDKKAEINLRAPSVGTYEGLALVRDRNCEKDKLKFSARHVSGMVGEIYAPESKIEIKGDKKKGNGLALHVGIITKTLKIDKVYDPEPDPYGGLPTVDHDPEEPDVVFNSSVGASARRAVLAE